jgi:guanylate kinase
MDQKIKQLDISIVVSAPSGTGKTSIIQEVIRGSDFFEFVVSTTTRPRRRTEVADKNYYFIGIDEFRGMIDHDEFIEWALVHENYYGITKKEIDRIKGTGKIPIFDVDVQGARTLRGRVENALFIYIVPPSLEVLQQRLRGRGTDSEEQISIRMKNAVDELRQYHYYDYIIINNSIPDSCEYFKAILMAEYCKRERIEPRIKTIVGE